MVYKIIEAETLITDSELSISKYLIKKDLGYRVLIGNSQNATNPEFWDYPSLQEALTKYEGVELALS